jgi:hypothetical protein
MLNAGRRFGQIGIEKHIEYNEVKLLECDAGASVDELAPDEPGMCRQHDQQMLQVNFCWESGA